MIRALLVTVAAGALLIYFTQGQASAQVTLAPSAPSPSPLLPASPIPAASPLPAAQLQIVQLVLQLRGSEDPALVLGIIQRESSFNANAFNPENGGSYGLMQVELPSAQQVGYPSTNPAGLYDPATNIRYGVAYLSWVRSYLARYGVTSDAAVIAGYNEGVRNVLAGLPDLAYVNAVQSYRTTWARWLNAAGYA